MADEEKVVASVWYHRGLPNFDDDSSLCHLDDGKGTPINLVLADDYEALRKRCEAVEARYRFLCANLDTIAALMAKDQYATPQRAVEALIDVAAAQEPSHG